MVLTDLSFSQWQVVLRDDRIRDMLSPMWVLRTGGNSRHIVAHSLPLAFITKQVTKESWPLLQRGLSSISGPWVETETQCPDKQAVLSSPEGTNISSRPLSTGPTEEWLLLKFLSLLLCVFIYDFTIPHKTDLASVCHANLPHRHLGHVLCQGEQNLCSPAETKWSIPFTL